MTAHPIDPHQDQPDRASAMAHEQLAQLMGELIKELQELRAWRQSLLRSVIGEDPPAAA